MRHDARSLNQRAACALLFRSRLRRRGATTRLASGYQTASFVADVLLGGSGCCGAVAINPLDIMLRLQKS